MGGIRTLIAGRYTLDREIGRGGMGAVWLGRDEVLGRAVALKRIGMLPGAGSPDFDRAEREARLAARLNHPHVVAVFDLVREGTEQWLVMEYVEGATLAELVRSRGALGPDELSPIIGQAADALAAAHAAGIVHRDVKPSNILVTPDGQVKLSDFGIARAQADASLTQTGLVTGSPAYLAPEVASGTTATSASDSWSLGATLFHALSGHPPYDVGDNLLGALYRIVHEEPPRAEAAGWLTSLLEHTMTRDPAARWDMAQVKDFLDAGPSAAVLRPATGRRGRRSAPPAPVAVPQTPVRGRSAGEGTQVFAPPTPVDPAAPVAPPPPPPGQRPPRRARRTVPWLPVLVAVAVLALVTVIGLAIGLRGDDDPGGPAASSPSSAGTSPTAAPDGPTAAGMRTFAQDYLVLAASDPRQAFDSLTTAYQDDSDGFEGYDGFWGGVSDVEVLGDIEADVADLTVTYRYQYELNGQQKAPERVQLSLVYDDSTDSYLISGATTLG